jgi:potassium/sodium efflux P-type ATPase
MALLRGMEPVQVFFMAVALAVSAIPEGLPVAITVALSIGMSRMAARKVIVRKLTAAEGLGSCTYIASDKTGTLTVNKLTVQRVFIPGAGLFAVSGEGYAPQGETRREDGGEPAEEETAALRRLAKAGVLCNEGDLHFDGEWKYSGDAVDIAFLTLGYKSGVDPGDAKQQYPAIKLLPFESETRYAAVFYNEAGRTRVAVKGGVETVMSFCGTMLGNGGVTELDRDTVEETALRLSNEGYKVLAVAEGEIGDGRNTDLSARDLTGLTFLGLAGVLDPVRPEARESVLRCRAAGVDVAMVTGDHPVTALAIARSLGIAESEREVVTGDRLAAAGTYDSADYQEIVRGAHVFARVSPVQKFEIVSVLKKMGHFVAVTGDGVNDAPALKEANIGVAMGVGTDIAKDTADIVITDNNFASIVAGVEEGRFAYGNVRKVTYLLISTGAAEVVLLGLAISLGYPLPLFPAQLLWLNLVTNGIQDVALAFERGEPGVMRHGPRDPKEGVFDRLMTQQVVLSGLVIGLVSFGAWVWFIGSGWSEFEARNMLLLLMVLFENVHVFNCRSEERSAFKVPLRNNKLLILGVLAAQGIHILAMNIPFMQSVLRVEPISFFEWLAVLGLALTVLLAMELFKLARRKWEFAGAN